MFTPIAAYWAGRFNIEPGCAPLQCGSNHPNKTPGMSDPADDTRPTEILVELARLGETRTWEPGATVVTEGDPADCMYIIHEGQLRAFVVGDGGREVELNTLGPGEFFGELMLSGELRAATVQAITRTRLTRITRAEMERALVQRPDLAFHLIQRLVERVRHLTTTVRRLASEDVYSRLVGFFESQARDEQGLRVVPGPMSQQRIAACVGASRAMVHRLLHDLAQGGYIELSRERIVLLKALPRRW
jgi:CRP/FNR family transcriptional regulator, cyclic AMP receptor protein